MHPTPLGACIKPLAPNFIKFLCYLLRKKSVLANRPFATFQHFFVVK